MVFMSMRDEDTTYTLLLICQIARIRDHQIDTKHFIIGEHHSDINHNQIVAVLDDHHILSDLSQSSERDESNFFCCQGTKNLLTTPVVCSIAIGLFSIDVSISTPAPADRSKRQISESSKTR